ncbi:hypothetical protein [Halocatena pleomorpha]|uniref:Uncharacterized protein n=1 Tax=Halocatena pleomorpha TaxID=1785090 RepID=A0A3P3RK18_9EURY|nr:hypothetical protein [Halocatena pleomorpha]RRJ33725.1 hypothetical protein EIK79_02725 [Halocatena pleomorpha]
MDRHLTLVLLTAVMLAVGVMPGTATNGSAQMEDGDPMGHSVSSFMQVSAVEADSTVDREMWRASFENAENESVKAELIEQRSEQLSRDLSAVHAQQEQIKNGTLSQAYTDALTAHVTELRQSVQNTSQTANKSNVSSESLSGLREEACSVPVSNGSEIVVVSNSTELRCPPQSPGGTPANDTTETPPATDNGSANNTTETPQGPGNNTTETPQTPGNNTTETPQTPGDNTTETPRTPGDNTTKTPQENTTMKTETTNDPTTILEFPFRSDRSAAYAARVD